MSTQGASGENALWRVGTWYPDIPATTLTRLQVYHAELLKFNARLNLVSRNTERDADEVHFADSILAARSLSHAQFSVPLYDLGSGNGFPGLVFSLLRSEVEVILVEADARKCEFLKHVIHVAESKNCKVMNVRIEALKMTDMQAAISRGFASVSKTLLSVNKIFAKGGRCYHMKGSNWGTEIAELPSQLISLWKPELLSEYVLPDSQARRAIVCTVKI